MTDAGWIILTGVLAATSCALLGTFLVLRKMSLLGDALSHAVLPGIAHMRHTWSPENRFVRGQPETGAQEMTR